LCVADTNTGVLSKPMGCEHCHDQGYRGRTGIYELVVVDNAMAELIHSGAGEHQLERLARERTPSIRDDGWRKVLAGETSIEEVLRVTRERSEERRVGKGGRAGGGPAEDGIRDRNVTGVQTCALPILDAPVFMN